MCWKGITTIHSGSDLRQRNIWIADDGYILPESQIVASPRIGVDYAAEDSLLPYRFYVRNNGYVSGKKEK